MIRIIESPQRSEHKISYSVEGEVLTITLNGTSESFDFTDLPEGKMESIEVDDLELNPIISAEKVGEEVIVTLHRFYSFEEKELFETGEEVSLPFGGGMIG